MKWRIAINWRKKGPKEMIWKEFETGKSRSLYWGRLPTKPINNLLRVANAPTLQSRLHRAINTPCLKGSLRKGDTIQLQTLKLQTMIVNELKKRKKKLIRDRRRRKDISFNRMRPQKAKAPPVPLTEFTALFNYSVLKEKWDKVKSDGRSFMGDKFRPDLAARLRVDFDKTMQLFEEIKRAYEI